MTVVTDHSVLRWLERHKGIDVGAIRAEIASHVPTGMANGNVIMPDGTRLTLREGAVVTVLSKPSVGKTRLRDLTRRESKRKFALINRKASGGRK